MQIINVTEEQVAAWKKEYGKLFQIDLADGRKIWLRKPDRNVVSMAMAKNRQNPLGMAEVIVANCYLGGDDVREDAGALVGITTVVDTIIGTVEAEVKNC